MANSQAELEQYLSSVSVPPVNSEHSDLLAALLGDGSASQLGKELHCTAPVQGGDLLPQAGELDIFSLLESGSAPVSSASHGTQLSTHSPRSSGSTTYSCLGGGSPMSSAGSGCGHDADVSGVSSPESLVSDNSYGHGSGDSLPPTSTSYMPTDSAVLDMMNAQGSIDAWASMSGNTLLDSLLADSGIPLNPDPSLMSNDQLASLTESLSLPQSNTVSFSSSTHSTAIDFSILTSSTMTTGGELNATTGMTARTQDVVIDVPLGAVPSPSSGLDGSPEQSDGEEQTLASGVRAPLELTAEEKRLLANENVQLPEYLPLTKQEAKELKRVQRKIKNKRSALDSRKRKKEYVDGLETRVQSTTDENRKLHKRVRTLEDTNKTLMDQLKRLQTVVMAIYPSVRPVHTGLAVFVLSFALFLVPGYFPGGTSTAMEVSMAYVGGKVRTRVLLASDFSNGYVASQSQQPPPTLPSDYSHPNVQHHQPLTAVGGDKLSDELVSPAEPGLSNPPVYMPESSDSQSPPGVGPTGDHQVTPSLSDGGNQLGADNGSHSEPRSHAQKDEI